MLHSWSDDDLDFFLKELKGDTLYNLASKAGMQSTKMLEVVNEACERAFNGERLIISTPPQEGKSTRCSVLFPVWAMQKKRGIKVAVASHNLDLAMRFSRQARELTRRLFGPITVPGEDRAQDWRTDNHSTYTAVGVDSSFTGRAVDLLVIDDPVKSANDARSDRGRQQVWDWWESVALTRLAPGAGVLVIMTRWHKDDLAGRLIKQGWESIVIPAQAEFEPDPLGRNIGDWLESVRGRSAEQWQETKNSLSNYFWRAMYQGSPVATVGKIIDPDKLVQVVADDFIVRQANQYWTKVGMEVVSSWDLSFTGESSSDYVSGQVWGKYGKDYFLLDAVHGKWDFTETCDQVLRLAAKWPQISRHLIEKAANGAALISQLNKQIVMEAVQPRGSKELRALACQPVINQGHVKVIDKVWNKDLYNELADFPTGANDDQVDAMTQALLSLKDGDFIRI